MKALHSWLLTEGAHGMISQAEGLAKALNTTFDHKKVKLPFYSKFLPPIITPKNRAFFNYEELTQNLTVIPDFLISCGRKSVIANLVLKKFFKKEYNKKIQNIHIQDPKISSKYFNFVIIPEHDNPVSGDNVLNSRGALHYLDEEDVKNTNLKNENVITFILGGPNKYYDYTYENMINIFSKIKKLLDKKNLQLIVVPSNRTPSKVIQFAKEYFNKNRLVIEDIDKKAYLSSLALAKYIIVTCDSSSMISEAALTGKPLYVAMIPPKKNDNRFQKFRNLLESREVIRYLKNDLDVWNYKKLDETKRIAKLIKEKIH